MLQSIVTVLGVHWMFDCERKTGGKCNDIYRELEQQEQKDPLHQDDTSLNSFSFARRPMFSKFVPLI